MNEEQLRGALIAEFERHPHPLSGLDEWLANRLALAIKLVEADNRDHLLFLREWQPSPVLMARIKEEMEGESG